MFFSFDGIDGVGKSTQIALFCDWLRAGGRRVVACRDPGSTPLGEEVRRLLLERSQLALGRRAEMLLYMAARAQLVEELIAPALAAGQTVVSDRFLLANVVYQGHAGDLPVDALWEIGRLATAGVEPDLTFLLDMSVEAAAARINRPLDRLESRGDEYRASLRAGFLSEAGRLPERIVVIDASQSVDQVQASIRRAADERLRGA